MNEILNLLNNLTADELDSVIMRANIILEKKRKDEAEQAALIEKERLRQEKIAQEKARQQEIAELQRKLAELQSQSAAAAAEEDAGVQGAGFVMHDKAPANEAPVRETAPKAEVPAAVTCPHCGHRNEADSLFCENCGKKVTAQPAPQAQAATQPNPAPQAAPRPQPAQQSARCPKCGHEYVAGSSFCEKCGQRLNGQSAPQPQPAQQSARCPKCGHEYIAGSSFCEKCGQRLNAQSAPQAKPAPQPQPAPQAKPVPQPQPATQPNPVPQAQPQAAAGQVKYADESMKKWEMLPDEKVVRGRHEIQFIHPDMGRKFQYQLEITNKRLLFTRMSAVAASAGIAFGLVGSIVREVTSSGPKPWLEIPYTAITACGLSGKKEFTIQADQTYTLKNKSYDVFIQPYVEQAHASR